MVEPELCRSTEAPDAHRMDLQNVFAFVQMIGGAAPPITIVGCEPSAASESIGLSPPVREAVVPAAAVIRRLVGEALAGHDVFERRSTV